MFPDAFRYFPRPKAVNLKGEARELVGDWGVVTSAAWTPDVEEVFFLGAPIDRPFACKRDLWVIGKGGNRSVPTTQC
jgi:hypothetical protein